jgi:hypothetical protein
VARSAEHRRGPALNIFPAPDGVQHCQVAGMRDTLDAYAAMLLKWGWLQRYGARQNWETNVRGIDLSTQKPCQ